MAHLLFVCYSFSWNITFVAELAVMVNVPRITYEKEVVHWDGDSCDVGSTGNYGSDRNRYNNIQTNKQTCVKGKKGKAVPVLN
jgi:hypothetical protein